MGKTKGEIWLERFLIIIIFSGAIIALANFINNKSLWLDEAMLALNIVSKSYMELLEPLDMYQIAPIGFLYIEKTMINLLGNHDWVLRIFPFLSFILSIPLFFVLNKKLFESERVALLSCAVFSLSLTLIMYSSEVKQYSSDVLLAILIVVSALNYHSKKSSTSLILYTIVGVFSICLSNISIIILFTVGLYSLYTNFVEDKNRQFSVFIAIFFWLVSFITYYFNFIHNHPSNEEMIKYWGQYFMPQNIFSLEFHKFLFYAAKEIFGEVLTFKRFWIIPLVLAFVGIASLIRRKQIKNLYLIVFPLLLHLVLSSFQFYPFAKSFILYLIPFLIIMFTLGFVQVYKYLNENLIKIPALALLIPVLVHFYPIIVKVPIEREEIKKSMAYLDQNIDGDDKIYIYCGAIRAFQFYRNSYPQIVNNNSIIYGTSHRENWSEYDQEILKLSGTNWLLFSHVYPFDPNDEDEEDYIIKTLKSNNYRVLDKQIFTGSSVYKISDEAATQKPIYYWR